MFMTVMTKLESSAFKICNNSPQIMIYGFQHCGYEEILYELTGSTSPFQKIFDGSCGVISEKTLEGSEIQKIGFDSDKSSRAFKSALVNIVFENYKRKKQGKEMIPILFCIDCKNNPYPPYPDTITSKLPFYNQKITHKELRRAYKLCEEFEDPEIRQIARQSFRFVKVINLDDGDRTLELLPAPWQHKDWDTTWSKRMKAPKLSTEKSKKTFWRKELATMKAEFDKLSEKSDFKHQKAT
jgi:hypothetical protein